MIFNSIDIFNSASLCCSLNNFNAPDQGRLLSKQNLKNLRWTNSNLYFCQLYKKGDQTG